MNNLPWTANDWAMMGFSVLTLGLMIAPAYQQSQRYAKDKAKVLSELQQAIDSIQKTGREVEFYTTGHPYVWVSTSLPEVHKMVNLSYSFGSGSQQAYQINISSDLSRGYVYVVPSVHGKVDSLMHYEEWLGSQSEVAKNIARYKASHRTDYT